jgi:hypothetical protein
MKELTEIGASFIVKDAHIIMLAAMLMDVD